VTSLVLWLACAHATAPPDAALDLQSGYVMPHAVADLDADGVGDLLFGKDTDVLLWPGVPGAAPAGVPIPYDVQGIGFIDILPGDYDGDGLVDVLVTSQVGGARRGLLGLRGQPGGPVPATWSLTDDYGYSFALGDIDGDGFDDAFVDTTMFLGGPTGPSEAGPAHDLVDRPRGVWALGDLDGDGFDDVGFQGAVDGKTASLVVLRGGLDGFDPVPLWTYGREEHDCSVELTAADVDGSGDDELVVVCAHLVDENASGFIDVLDDIQTTPRLRTSTPFAFSLAYGLELATLDDWNGDGVEEVVFGAQGSVRELPWSDASGLELEAMGALTWSPGNPRAALEVTTADISGDGRGDLVVSWFDFASGHRTATVWLGPEPEFPVETGHTGDTGRSVPAATGDTGGIDATGDTGSEGTEPTSSPSWEGDEGGCGCTQVGPMAGGLGGLLLPWVLRRRA